MAGTDPIPPASSVLSLVRSRSHRLLLGAAAAVLAVVVAVAALALLEYRRLGEATAARHAAAEDLIRAERIRGDLGRWVSAERALLFTGQAEFRARAAEASNDLETSLGGLRSAAATQAERERVTRLIRRVADHREAIDRVAAARTVGGAAEVEALFTAELSPRRDAIAAALTELVTDRRAALAQAETSASRVQARTIRSLALMTAIASVLIVTAAFSALRAARQDREQVERWTTFVSVVAHDLKAPLTALLLRIQYLRRQIEGPAPPGAALADGLARAEAKVRSMAGLVRDVLDCARMQLVPLLRKSLKLFVAVMGGIFVLQNLDVDVSSLLTGLGLGGLAFALAAKDAIGNLFGSVMIFADKPFQIGDWVIIQGVEGNVEEVGLRTLRIRTFYNSVVSIPNGAVMNAIIDNMGARRYRRYKTLLGLTYDTPPEKMQAFLEGLRGIVQAMPGMRKDYYMVEFTEYAPHSLDVLLYCFMDAPDWATELRTRTHLNLEILRFARELGVSFAFPTRTVHVEPAGDARLSPVPDPARLAATIRAFGPGGELARPRGIPLIEGGFDPAATVQRGEDA